MQATLLDAKQRCIASFASWVRHLQRIWYWYALAAITIFVIQHFFFFGINTTGSMHGRVYVVIRGTTPQLNDEVAFVWHNDAAYSKGSHFFKRIAGVPGDEIDVKDRKVYLNGKLIGEAKTHSRIGTLMEPIKPGVIPPGYYFVVGDHPDSLDSRYEITGLISAQQFIGKGYAIF